MIKSVPMPTGPALIYNNLYNLITKVFFTIDENNNKTELHCL